jgi:hypothetical protein
VLNVSNDGSVLPRHPTAALGTTRLSVWMFFSYHGAAYRHLDGSRTSRCNGQFPSISCPSRPQMAAARSRALPTPFLHERHMIVPRAVAMLLIALANTGVHNVYPHDRPEIPFGRIKLKSPLMGLHSSTCRVNAPVHFDI